MSEMRDLIAGLPDQLRWAAEMSPPAVPPASGAVVAGMGGSGMAGTIASVVAAETGGRVAVHQSYDLPGWVSPDQLVVAVSFSGNTEETLSALAAAGDAPVVAVTTGGALAALADEAGWPRVEVPAGPQPRAAVGHLAGGALRALESAGVVPDQTPGLLEAADVVDRLLGDGDGPGVALAEDLADALRGRATIVYGGHGGPAVAANRWKTQINENGKAPSWWSVFPELDHNEIVGWTAWPQLGKDALGVVFLRDPTDHPRIGRRIELTRRLIEDDVAVAGEVTAQGEGTLARMFSLMVVGDLVSVSIAEAAGVDPVPVEVIEALKKDLDQGDETR